MRRYNSAIVCLSGNYPSENRWLEAYDPNISNVVDRFEQRRVLPGEIYIFDHSILHGLR